MTTAAEIDTRSIGDLINEGMRPVRKRYYADVNSIAAEAVEVHPDDEDEREEFVWESVDGSEWVIYYSSARAVALLTDNLDAASDAGVLDSAVVRANCSIETTLALYAMIADVNDAIARRERV